MRQASGDRIDIIYYTYRKELFTVKTSNIDRISKLNWHTQQLPSQQSFLVWKKFLFVTVGLQPGGILMEKLGPWKELHDHSIDQ